MSILTDKPKRQIIIVRTQDCGSGCYECAGLNQIIECTEQWDEVTNEEYDIILRMSFNYNFQIIERNPVNSMPSKALLRTPRDYLAKWEEDQAEMARKRQEMADKRAAKKQQDDVKALERKRKQFEKLKQELGEQ